MHSSPRTYIADYIRSISNEGFSNADVAWASDWVRRGAFADSGGVSGTAAEVDNIEIRKKNMEASGFSSRAERKTFVKEADRIEVEAVKEKGLRELFEDKRAQAYAVETAHMEDSVGAISLQMFKGTVLVLLGEYPVKRVDEHTFTIAVSNTKSFGRYQFSLKNVWYESFASDVERELRGVMYLFSEE